MVRIRESREWPLNCLKSLRHCMLVQACPRRTKKCSLLCRHLLMWIIPGRSIFILVDVFHLRPLSAFNVLCFVVLVLQLACSATIPLIIYIYTFSAMTGAWSIRTPPSTCLSHTHTHTLTHIHTLCCLEWVSGTLSL